MIYSSSWFWRRHSATKLTGCEVERWQNTRIFVFVKISLQGSGSVEITTYVRRIY